MILGLDVDGIFSNFSTGYAKVLTEETGIIFPDYSKVEPETWYWEREAGVTKEQEAKVWERIKASPYFWLDLEPHEGAVDFLNKLNETFHEVYFITDRPGHRSQDQTVQWLSYWIDSPSVIISRHGKGVVCKAIGIEVYLDDKQENILDVLEKSPLTDCYMLNKPYNKELHGIDLAVKSLAEFGDRTNLWKGVVK